MKKTILSHLKKTLFVFMMYTSTLTNAQTNATVTIISVTQSVVCNASTVTVRVKMVRPSAPTNYLIWFNLDNGTIMPVIWSGHYSLISKCPWVLNSHGDTLWCISMPIPPDFPQGPAKVTHSIYSANVLINCSFVGISEYTLDKDPVVYYDMQGRVIHNPYMEGRYNELLMQRTGTEPYYTYTKIYIQP